MYEFNAEKVKNEVISWMRDWENDNATGCNFVVGISGGKDSSVVAALCVEAFGKDRVIGVMLPQGIQADIDASYELINYLGINHYTINIESVVNSVVAGVDKEQIALSEQARTNLPARLRMSILYAVAQSLNGRVANTCNLSETLLSWETRWGDAVGDFAPISDLTVSEVKAIGYVLGLPEELIEKVPSDGLCGTSDEEAMGIPYDVMDRYVRTGEIDDVELKRKIDARVNNYRFKREPVAHFRSNLKAYVK